MTESVSLGSNNILKFYSDFENTEMLPVRNFEFVDHEYLYGRDLFLRFLTKRGSYIRQLGLDFLSYRRKTPPLGIDFLPYRRKSPPLLPEVVMKKIQVICSLTPNLKHLKLIVQFSMGEIFPDLSTFNEKVKVTLPHVESLCLHLTNSLSKQFLDGLFTMLPNVRIIEVYGGYQVNLQVWEGFVNIMTKLNVHTFVRTVNHNYSVHLDLEEPGIWIAMAQNRSLKLNNVSMFLNIPVDADEEDAVRMMMAQEDFLKAQSENLEVLSIEVFEMFRRQINFHVQWPVMKKLTKATFEYSKMSEYTDGEEELWYCPVFPLEPEKIPELKTLRINPRAISSGLFANSLFPSVQEIDFFDCDRDLQCFPLPLPQIVSKFPNLRKMTNIEVRRDLSYMETIFTNLGSIEDLELTIENNYDRATQDFNYAVSGIPSPVNTKWALSQLADRVGYEALPSWIEPPRPSLRDLKRKSYLTDQSCSCLLFVKNQKLGNIPNSIKYMKQV